MTDLIRIGTACTAARVYRGSWIADCPWCNGAVPLQFGAGGFICEPPGCGAGVEVIWPTPEMRQGVERLLSMRPSPENRSWFPGETLQDLIWENGAHGVLDGLEEILTGTGPAMVVEADRIRLDLLPELLPAARPAVTS